MNGGLWPRKAPEGRNDPCNTPCSPTSLLQAPVPSMRIPIAVPALRTSAVLPVMAAPPRRPSTAASGTRARFPLCEGFFGRLVLPRARSRLTFAPAERRIDHQALCDHGRSAGGGCRGSGRLCDGGSGLRGRRHGVGPGRDRRVHQHAGGRVEPRQVPRLYQTDPAWQAHRMREAPSRKRGAAPHAWPWST